jgi:hypothetical protein
MVSKRIQWAGSSCWVASLIAIIALLQIPSIAPLKQNQGDPFTVRFEQTLLLATTLEWLGAKNLAVSWLWLEFIQYYGDVASRAQTGYGLSLRYLDRIIALDPQFLTVYPWLTSVAFSSGDPDTAEKLIDQGLQSLTLEQNPQAWKLLVDKAVIQFLLKGNAEKGTKHYHAAADWLDAIGQETEANAFRSLGDRLRASPNSRRVRFDVWQTVLQGTADPETRKRAIIELGKLGGKFIWSPDGQLERIIPPES